ncbi:MAG: hypothetical protein WA324_02770 [Bryobacteraceae bacterium]
MYRYRAACFLVVISAGLVGLGAAAGTRGEIPLKPGDYVLDGTGCGDAPFAAMANWDGIGFGGAHESHCKTTILHQRKRVFDVETTCSALGDGSPATPTSWKERITVSSETSFSRSAPGQAVRKYHWCAATKASQRR